ncbi:MAG: hypothetical protein QN128_11410, partial [Armatimonadota bacterium]|nr:hypothetical protein [Armatimonadota bacterium]
DLNLLSDLVERLRRGEVDSAKAVKILEALGATGEEGVQLAARLKSLATELAKGGELTEEGAAALRRAGELIGSLIPGEVEALLKRYGPQLAGFAADVKLYLDLLEKLEPGKGGALHATIAEAQSSLLKGSLEKLRAGAEAAAWRETVSGTGSYKGVTFRFVRTPEVDEAGGAYTLRTRLELPGGRVAEVVQRVEVDDPSALASLRRWLAGKIPVDFIAEKVYKPVKARVYTTVFYDPPLTGEAAAELELIGRIARGDPEALKLLGLEGAAILLRAPELPAHLKQLLATTLAPGVAGAQQYVQLTVRTPTGELVRFDEPTVRELVGRIARSAAGAAREELEQLARQLRAVAPAALLYNIDLKPAAEALAARGVDLSWLRTYGIEPPKPILPVEKPPEVAPKPPEPAGAPEVTPPAARGEVEKEPETVKPPEATPPTEKEKEKEKEERKEEKEKEEKEEREKTKEKEGEKEGEEVSEEEVVGGEEGEVVSPPDLRGLSFEEIARAIGIAPVGWSVYAVNVRGAWEVRDRLLPEHEWVKPFLEPLLQRDVEYAFFVPAIDADQRVWPLFIFVDPRAWERLRDRIRERTFDLTGAGLGIITLPVLDVGVEPAPVAGVIESPVQVEGVISELGLPEIELQLELEAKEGEPLIPKLTITLPAPTKPAWKPEEGGAVQAAARAPGWGARARQREILVV